VEPLDGVEQVVARHRRARDPGQQRTHRPQGAALRREDPLDVPGQRLGQREQPQRLTSRRAVDDDEVPRAARHLPGDLEQGEDLLGARQDRELLGLQRVDAGPLEQTEQVALHVRQVRSNAAWVSTCMAYRPVSTSVGSPVSGVPRASASEWAGSVDRTRVLLPRAAAAAAVAAEAVVLPTPPLPVNSSRRTPYRPSCSTRFLSSFSAESMIIFSALRLNIRASASRCRPTASTSPRSRRPRAPGRTTRPATSARRGADEVPGDAGGVPVVLEDVLVLEHAGVHDEAGLARTAVGVGVEHLGALDLAGPLG
jgi:hypothetical protein